ncbi:MAG: sensor histidine kinase [Syntrophobacteraceae bacterium]
MKTGFMQNLQSLKSSRLRMLFFSLKGQIFIAFAATFVTVCALSILNFWNISVLRQHLLIEDRYYDLLNSVLEVRRYEKNYLLYKDRAAMREAKHYLEKIDSMVKDLRADIRKLTGTKTTQNFLNVLGSYHKTLSLYQTGAMASADADRFRREGKELTDFAVMFLRVKQVATRQAIGRVSVLPVAFFAIFLLLMLLVIKLVSIGLLRPLKELQTTIHNVARGDYSPAGYDGPVTEEIKGFIDAYNWTVRELEANQEHLLQARKMAALGTFTAGIAHELNNPLNNISLTAETFLDQYLDRMNEEERGFIDDILAQSDRACEIVRNLLDFSRTDHANCSSLQVGELMQSTAALLKNQINFAAVRFEMQLAQDLPPIYGNFRTLQQVFMNLLLNALAATPAGGTIAVEAACGAQGYVAVRVRDTGSGIKPESLEHIFEPFYTTKGVGQGTGLGLSVVYSIVKRHGGKIDVESQAGLGTTFTVSLPIVRCEEDNRLPNSGPQALS